ncbi:MAG: heme-binding domain-containing protein [Cyclobacteriaceae bacterium]|nr:heme-binding domain-containing protein [Cyclobacteriaceae bacterium]
MKKLLLYIAGLLAVIFIVIQFVPSNMPENDSDISDDLLVTEQAPENIKLLMHQACYDCHSNQTKFPWYAKVAPVSWLLENDVKEGREELNFSEWATLDARKKIKMLSEIGEEVEEKKMPLKIYTVIHTNAALSAEEIELINDWTVKLSDQIMEN